MNKIIMFIFFPRPHKSGDWALVFDMTSNLTVRATEDSLVSSLSPTSSTAYTELLASLQLDPLADMAAAL